MSMDLWQRGCERLSGELPAQQFDTWIKPLAATVTGGQLAPQVALAGADAPFLGAGAEHEPLLTPHVGLQVGSQVGPLVVHLRVPNRFKLDWIRSQYAGRIEAVLSELAGQSVRLELSVTPRQSANDAPMAPWEPGKPPEAAAQPVASAALRMAGAASAGHAMAHLRVLPAAPTPQRLPPHGMPSGLRLASPTAPSHRLNTSLTFDTLVAGRANQMARTAALHVAGAPGAMYNPLFIYGGVGLGKTHLVHAVGNALLRDNPQARVLYLHAEQFISDVVKNYQRKTFDELKAKYHSLDLLLIDDVQFFAGKDRTQEEFFNAFEALLAKRAHIIMTSDTYPKGLVDIDERLTSRFDAGLTVAIEPPELEMRVAILIKKAAAEGTELAEDVAFFIAKNVRANVRELEGALRKVLAYSRFSHKDITITLAREALKDLLSIQNRQIGVENIQKTVADFYKIKVADMYSKKRPASIARPRQIAMYLAKDMTKKSLPEIGELFGGRDHTTVLHAVRKIADERQRNSELNQQLHVLEQTLKG